MARPCFAPRRRSRASLRSPTAAHGRPWPTTLTQSARVRWARRADPQHPDGRTASDGGLRPASRPRSPPRLRRHHRRRGHHFSFEADRTGGTSARRHRPPRRPRRKVRHARRHPSERQSRARRGRRPPAPAIIRADGQQLHRDNLVALAREDPTLGLVPGYAAVCATFMPPGQGLGPGRNRRHPEREGDEPFAAL